MIYVDRESWLPLYSDVYDASGALWKVIAQYVRWARTPRPGAGLEYPEERGFIGARTVVKVQTAHATRGTAAGLDDAQFSVSTLTGSARQVGSDARSTCRARSRAPRSRRRAGRRARAR